MKRTGFTQVNFNSVYKNVFMELSYLYHISQSSKTSNILACPNARPEHILLQYVSFFMILFTTPQLNKIPTNKQSFTYITKNSTITCITTCPTFLYEMRYLCVSKYVVVQKLLLVQFFSNQFIFYQPVYIVYIF